MRRIRYTANGLEGTDFRVDIGATMASNTYDVFGASCGVRITAPDVIPASPGVVPVMDFPDEPGDRTATSFRVVTADVLFNGDELAFLIMQ